MDRKLRESERRQYANRLSAPGEPDADLEKDLRALKAADRYEIAVDLASQPAGDEKREDAQVAITGAIPAILGDDYVRGLKPDVASKRLAAIVRAARRVAGVTGESGVLLAFLERASGLAEGSQRVGIDPELVVGAARLERPSGRALRRALAEDGRLSFAGRALWARLAIISASAEPSSPESADLASAIDRVYTVLGPATNIVPVELRVLRRALDAVPPSPAAVLPNLAAGTVVQGRPDSVAVLVPSANHPSSVRDSLEMLLEVGHAIREERKHRSIGNPDLEKKLEQYSAELAQLRIDLNHERDEGQKSEERARVLEHERERERVRAEQARAERDEAKSEMESARRSAKDFERRLHETEALLNSAVATAMRTTQRRLREQCLVPLQELGEYISKAVAGGDFDMAKLVRSYAQFEKVFRRISTPDMRQSEPGDSGDSAADIPKGRDAK